MNPNPKPQAESPPLDAENEEESLDEHDGGYGWVCVVAQLLITANTWGVNGSFGVYLDHYLSTNAFQGTSQVAYAFVGGLSISQMTLVAPLVTHATKRFGLKPTLVFGLVLETGALIAASYATELWHLCLTQGFLFGWGSSFLYVGTYGIIPQWFNRRIGVATGIASAGSGLGGLIHSLGSQAMISRLGLSWSFRITAICTGVAHAICTILIRDRNKHVKPQQHYFDASLLKSMDFLLILFWTLFSATGYTVVLFSLPNNAIEIGATFHQASIVGAMVNLGMAIGRPLVGYFSDHVGKANMSLIGTILASIFCLALWTSANNLSTLFAFAILGGMVLGTFWATMGSVLVATFGIKRLPSTLSVAWTLISFPTAFAEAIALGLRRPHAPVYHNVQIFAGFMFFGGFVCLALLRFLPHIRREATQ
ncbi:major facilitator superfamily domain-containing protein [Dactylonectria estremocensis]|uniref:Major facilitator superfamily domain-containing protein n=1 Tax=Dactylonectria estremocensis TaxID=1079267 RepID=A0A9P9I9Y7_9HYPO|nr:major facilitator superfamily domain-containing protein [Dactylonectria estremocensis]